MSVPAYLCNSHKKKTNPLFKKKKERNLLCAAFIVNQHLSKYREPQRQRPFWNYGGLCSPVWTCFCRLDIKGSKMARGGHPCLFCLDWRTAPGDSFPETVLGNEEIAHNLILVALILPHTQIHIHCFFHPFIFIPKESLLSLLTLEMQFDTWP